MIYTTVSPQIHSVHFCPKKYMSLFETTLFESTYTSIQAKKLRYCKEAHYFHYKIKYFRTTN